jgi:hypothetical protein
MSGPKMQRGWNNDLWCHPESMEYDFKSNTGVLRMPPVECCDMSGCIKMFKKIDPRVKRINTISGKYWDMIYILTGDEWKSFLPDSHTPAPSARIW